MNDESEKEVEAIQRLREAGFILRADVWGDYNDTPLQVALRYRPWHHYFIHKPKRLGGNRKFGADDGSICAITTDCGETEYIPTDWPVATIFNAYTAPQTWYFGVDTTKFRGERDSAGHFIKAYPEIHQAVNAVFDYYFGDPSWMNSAEVFEEDFCNFVWFPTYNWFRENWERQYLIDREVEFRDIFSFVYWRATFDRPITSARHLYYRFKYTNPYPYNLYDRFVRTSYGFRHYDKQGKKLKRRHLCVSIAVKRRPTEAENDTV